jgi:mono/diheme cytochrome c family protein
MPKRSMKLAMLAVLAAGAAAALGFTFGGWATITVDDLPQSLTVGQPTRLGFMVRQHGMTLLGNLKPSVVATSGSTNLEVEARPNGVDGHYEASIIVPKTGRWTLELRSGFGPSNAKLYPIAAYPAGTKYPVEAPMETGRRLFVAKGCVTCHVRGVTDGNVSRAAGPDLTPKRYQAEYLARFLADPSIQRTPGAQWTMPNLALKQTEIASLVAFLNAP